MFLILLADLYATFVELFKDLRDSICYLCRKDLIFTFPYIFKTCWCCLLSLLAASCCSKEHRDASTTKLSLILCVLPLIKKFALMIDARCDFMDDRRVRIIDIIGVVLSASFQEMVPDMERILICEL